MAVTGQVGQAECGTWTYVFFAVIFQFGCYVFILDWLFTMYFMEYFDPLVAGIVCYLLNLLYSCCTDSTKYTCN
jgi:hypothetical protein